MERLFLMSGSK